MKYNINLLVKKEKTLAEKLVYFALHYLRYIIVITQLVVIGVFFYRFRIDQSIVDLREAVNQKKEIIQVALPLLQKAEQIDWKTKEIQKILTKQKLTDDMIQYIISLFPESLTLSQMTADDTTLNLTGTTPDPKQLQNFYLVLKQEGKFKSVELEKINKKEEVFSFVLVLKNFSN
jgi:Tfp pilus assembly protein PilN